MSGSMPADVTDTDELSQTSGRPSAASLLDGAGDSGAISSTFKCDNWSSPRGADASFFLSSFSPAPHVAHPTVSNSLHPL